MNSPYVPASLFLLFTLAGTLLIQALGHYLNISLVTSSLPLAAIPAFALTYGYFFSPGRLMKLALTLLVLAALGLASATIYDFTADGMGYQQPGAEAILNGWNPLHHDAKMLWLNLYPSGVWELEASLAWLYGSIEAAKTLHLWWIAIALPILLAGIEHYRKEPVSKSQAVIALLIVFCPITFTQMLTHYIDAMLYLAGITFIGAILLHDSAQKQRALSLAIMACSVLFMVNAKLSGIYHAVMLCVIALAFLGMRTKRLPVADGLVLFISGLIAVLFLGFHPYVTNILTYGSLLHMDSGTFTGFQRPSNLAEMNRITKFFYSLFSATGTSPRGVALLKFPWQILPQEWRNAGTPDSRTGGFGVLFAASFIASLALLASFLRSFDKSLLALAGMLFASSLLFPENWWARYVPFAYTAILLALLGIRQPAQKLQRALYTVAIALLIANSAIAAACAWGYYSSSNAAFMNIVQELKEKAQGNAYLVPPGDDYEIYNHAHLSLQRRLMQQGIKTVIKINAACPHKAGEMSEFSICY